MYKRQDSGQNPAMIIDGKRTTLTI